jgi:nitrogen fixation protein NifU and related proteins
MTDLYQEELMDLYRNPHNRGKMTSPSVSVSKKNPMCGDEIELQLKLADEKITEAKFEGSACSVSIISSSILTDYLLGKTLAEVKNITQADLLKLVNLNLTTSRVACATLALNALQEALKKYEETN